MLLHVIGDRRDDYLSVDDEGRVIAYINGGIANGNQIWLPQDEIASGVGGTRGEVRFADLDGDGRVEYLHVHENGAVTSWRNVGAVDSAFPGRVTWVPQGQIVSGIGKDGEGVHFADLNGIYFNLPHTDICSQLTCLQVTAARSISTLRRMAQ
jgi:hypothetical protein